MTDKDKCGRGSGKEAPPFPRVPEGVRRERICKHQREQHRNSGGCLFCPCGGFVERLPR